MPFKVLMFFAVGLGKMDPNIGLYDKTGRKPFYSEAFINMIKHCHKLNNTNDKVVYQAIQENLA